MAWLYVPELLDLTLESSPLSQTPEPFVMSKGKPIQPRSLLRKFNRDSWMMHLSTLMLPPLTVQNGLEKWITSLPDSHANLGQKQGPKREHLTRDGSGLTSPESFARFDPNSSSWKTFQTSLTGDSLPYSGTWPRSGSMQNGVLSKRAMLVLAINETGFSSSPTMFPTPTTIDNALCPSMANKSPAHQNLRNLPTPCARDWKDIGTSPSEKNRNSPPLAVHAGGRLNPIWIEWLMGFPIGWTEFVHSGTQSFHFKQLSLTASSSTEKPEVYE